MENPSANTEETTVVVSPKVTIPTDAAGWKDFWTENILLGDNAKLDIRDNDLMAIDTCDPDGRVISSMIVTANHVLGPDGVSVKSTEYKCRIENSDLSKPRYADSKQILEDKLGRFFDFPAPKK